MLVAETGREPASFIRTFDGLTFVFWIRVPITDLMTI